MSKVSIIIPSRAEIQVVGSESVLERTICDIYEKATGDFEVLVGMDGYPYPDISNRPNLKVVRFPEVVGIKTNINALASMAKGKYIYKSDSHCAFDRGFDEILAQDMQDNWIMMPRFKILTSNWQIQERNSGVEFYDYFYLCCPFTDKRGFRFKAGGHWSERTKERLYTHRGLDETPQIHGSGWMMTRDHFFELGGFPNIDPHGHAQEPIWLALKNWLGGGRVIVNKKTWYAHMHQQGNKRGYHMDRVQEKRSYDLAVNYWMGDNWFERKYNLSWFINKFMPMPTWPENWMELYTAWQRQ